MTAFSLGEGTDLDVMVLADWLEDHGYGDHSPNFRAGIAELQAFDAALADLASAGRCRPGLIRLLVRPGRDGCRLVASHFQPLPGHSGRRHSQGWLIADGPVNYADAASRSVPAPCLGAVAATSANNGRLVAKVLIARYGLTCYKLTDAAGTFELTGGIS